MKEKYKIYEENEYPEKFCLISFINYIKKTPTPKSISNSNYCPKENLAYKKLLFPVANLFVIPEVTVEHSVARENTPPTTNASIGKFNNL